MYVLFFLLTFLTTQTPTKSSNITSNKDSSSNQKNPSSKTEKDKNQTKKSNKHVQSKQNQTKNSNTDSNKVESSSTNDSTSINSSSKTSSDKSEKQKKTNQANQTKKSSNKKVQHNVVNNKTNKNTNSQSSEIPTQTKNEEEEDIIIVPSNKRRKNKKKIKKTKLNKTKKQQTLVEEEDDIVITGTMTKRKLKNVPVKTEVIRKEKIEAKGATNLIEALDSETGVHIDNQCSLCNTTSIKLSGLPGRYTLFLVDGMPLYSSLGSTYGLAGIVTAFVDRIEIVKGASSVLYGSSAIGGVVNVITKRPSGKHTEFEMKYGSYGYNFMSLGASANKAGVFGDGTFLGMSVVASYEHSDSVDRDGDHITELAAFSRSLLGGNVYIHPRHNIDILFRSTVLQGKRHGGGTGDFLEVINDWNSDTFTGRRAVSESILTRRMENAITASIYGDKIKASLIMATTYHRQDSDYEGEYYKGTQWLYYVSPYLHMNMGQYYGLLTGLSYRQEKLSENLATSDYNYKVAGVFAEGNFHIGKMFEVLHGLRYDYHNVFGSIITPRLAVKYAPIKNLTFRTAIGTGFRAPTTFYEYNHGVHPGGYTVQMDAKNAEHSIGGTFSINYAFLKNWNFIIETAYNKVEDAIAIEGMNNGSIMRVFNVSSPLEVFSNEAQLKGKLSKNISMELGYGNYHYKDKENVLISAPPTHQFTASLLFKRKNFSAYIDGKLYAPMNLRSVYGFGYNPKQGITLDELLDPNLGADTNSPKLEKSPWWGILNFKVEYKLSKQMHIYTGIDNILDYHQNDVESPIYYPASAPGASPDIIGAMYIWGPLKGRFIYAGIKLVL